MRLIVMFDIPNGSPALRKQYARFRSVLVSEGFIMEQFSIYSRLVATREACCPIIARLRLALPEAGRVTVLELTERQYARRHILVSNLPTVGCRVEDSGQLVLML